MTEKEILIRFFLFITVFSLFYLFYTLFHDAKGVLLKK